MLQRVKDIQYPLHPNLSIFAMLRIRHATCVAYTMTLRNGQISVDIQFART
jgi:hypothetical protein